MWCKETTVIRADTIRGYFLRGFSFIDRSLSLRLLLLFQWCLVFYLLFVVIDWCWSRWCITLTLLLLLLFAAGVIWRSVECWLLFGRWYVRFMWWYTSWSTTWFWFHAEVLFVFRCIEILCVIVSFGVFLHARDVWCWCCLRFLFGDWFRVLLLLFFLTD